MEGKCYCCGKAGHMSNNCRHKDKPKSEWVVNKAKKEVAHVQQQVPSSPTTTITPTVTHTTSSTGWAGVHVHQQIYQDGGMRDVILLDNQSTASIFCTKGLVEEIHEVDEPLILKKMVVI
jgi:hypothetical protein